MSLISGISIIKKFTYKIHLCPLYNILPIYSNAIRKLHLSKETELCCTELVMQWPRSVKLCRSLWSDSPFFSDEIISYMYSRSK